MKLKLLKELRLEEDARLLDLRGNKIATLEAQLKNIIYGAAKGTYRLIECHSFFTVPPKLLNTVNLESDMELLNGNV